MRIRAHSLKPIEPVKLKERPRRTERKATFEGELYIAPLERGITLTQGGASISLESWLENWGFRVNQLTHVHITIEKL